MILGRRQQTTEYVKQPAIRSCDVLLVLGHRSHAKSYVASGLLARLVDRGMSVTVVGHKADLREIEARGHDVQTFSIDDLRPDARRLALLNHLRTASIVHRRSQAEYRYKFARRTGASVTSLIATALWYAADVVSDSERLAARWHGKLRPSKVASDLVYSLRPRLLVWPTTISDPIDFELVQAAHKQGVPILMCEGSWDNLTSKGAIWPPPDRILVWGEHSRQQALKHHGSSDAQIAVTGPPHFDVYAAPETLIPREQWFAQQGLDPSRRLIFFASGTLAKFSDEAFIVRRVSEWIESGALPASYIWYRRHPKARARAEREGIPSLPHVVMDPGVPLDEPQDDATATATYEDIRQLAEALNACDTTLSAYSTIVLEGMLLGKPSVLLGFTGVDGKRPPTIHPSLEWEHVKCLLRSPWIKSAYTSEDLLSYLREFLQPQPDDVANELRRSASYVANSADGLTHERIVKEIEHMLRQNEDRLLPPK